MLLDTIKHVLKVLNLKRGELAWLSTSHVAPAFTSSNSPATLLLNSPLPHPLFWDTDYMYVNLSSAYYNWTPQTMWFKFTSHSFGGGEVQIKIRFGIWWGPASCFLDNQIPMVSPNNRSSKKALQGPFYKYVTNLIHEGPTHLMQSHWVVGLSLWICQGLRWDTQIFSPKQNLFYILSVFSDLFCVYPKISNSSGLSSHLLILSLAVFNLW